jgi:tetratricopeptide (TPR) repeat protein
MNLLDNKYRLGDLALELGIISPEKLKQSLAIAGDTGLPLGRVFVLSGLLSESDMANIIRCQTLLRENLLDLMQARYALNSVRGTKTSLDVALGALGWDASSRGDMTPLGELLVGCELLSQEQLSSYLRQQNKTKLPLGRMLIAAGAITDSFLTTALNVQIMVRNKKLTKAQARDALFEARRRQFPKKPAQSAKGFYELPARNVPKLGELLVISGVLNESQLSDALELSLMSRKAIGEVLVERQLLSAHGLESALIIQGRIARGEMSIEQARAVMLEVRSGRSVNEAMGIKPREEAAEKPKPHLNLIEFLKSLSCTDDNEITRAFEVARTNAQLVKHALLLAGSIDENTMGLAEQCHSLYLSNKLTFENSCTAFDYARRRSISLDEALSELRWLNPVVKVEPVNRKTGPTNSQLLSLRDLASDMLNRREYAAAQKVLEQLLQELKPANDKRYVYCLEQMARLMCEQQEFARAEEYARQLVDCCTTVYGADSLELANALNELGKILYFQQRYEQAIELAKKFIAICTSNQGKHHPDVACGWQNLAMLYYRSGALVKARGAYETAVIICTDSLGTHHPTTLNLLSKLAAIPVLEGEQLNPEATVEFDDSASITGNWRTIALDPNIPTFSADD